MKSKKPNFSLTDDKQLLNSQQQQIRQLVWEGKNICFTGSAGTGKSFLLRQIISDLQTKHGKNKVGVTSLTGTGADIIGGTTLASLLGLKNDSHLPKEVLEYRIMKSSSNYARRNWKKLKVLIIDEISMLDAELFDKLEWLAREIRMNFFPFGKIQLVLVGDFCQLPPINDKSGYCFEASKWNECVPITINLTQIYRQKDPTFINYLESIRLGKLAWQDWNKLLTWKQKEPNWPQDGIKPVNLFATNQEVNGINEQELRNLEQPPHFFPASDWEQEVGKLAGLVKNCLAVKHLELKEGTQVMLIRNWHEENLVNGSQGVVIGFTNNNYPIVKFTNGKKMVVREHTWEKIEGYDENNEPIITATRTQIPLILAWAMTIHKSQGQTIERLKVDLSKCFIGGQIYTALSRASNPEYLQIINFPLKRLWCNWKVKEYYHNLGKKDGNFLAFSPPTTKNIET